MMEIGEEFVVFGLGWMNVCFGGVLVEL